MLFCTRAREGGDTPFLWRKQDGHWGATSWAEAARQAAGLAAALKALGLQRGDRVMLVSENRPEWCISDIAIVAAGCVTVPTYTTNTERDHTHRSEEHTSELQSLMRISYAVFCLKKKNSYTT